MTAFAQPRWVDALRAGKGIYHLAELSRLSGLSLSSTRRAAQRLADRGWLVRLGKSLYGNRLSAADPPTLERAALRLYPPMGISLESALFLHGVLDQSPQTVTCVTTNKPKVFETGLGTIEFHQLAPALFFGYELLDGSPVATPEKAALDLMYLRCKRGETTSPDDWNWDHLRAGRLRALARSFPRAVGLEVQAALATHGVGRKRA